MPVRERFILTHQLEVAALPKDTTGAVVATDWFDLSNASGIVFIIVQGAWAVATPAVVLAQSTVAAGTSPKAVSFPEKFSKVGLATSGKFVKAAVVADTFNLTTVANTMTAIEVSAEMLDRDNGFQYIQLGVATPGANACLIAVFAILYGIRNQGDPAVILDDAKV